MKYDEISAKEKLYDEIMEHAESRMASGLKSKYAPKPAPSAKAPAAPQEEEFDAEELERLAALAGE